MSKMTQRVPDVEPDLTVQTYAALDKHSPVPLYYQLRQALETMIHEGKYKPGEFLPSEKDLCRMFRVSRITVRRAVLDMIEDGLLCRSHPRGRPQVSPTRVYQELTRLRGFFREDMLTAGLQPHTIVLATERVTGGRAASQLALTEQQPIFRIERLHTGNGEPMAIQTSYIPVDVCPDLERYNLAGSLFSIVEETYHEPIVRAVQHLRVREVTRLEAERLHMPRRSPVIQVDRISYAADDRAVEYFICVLPSDRYDFTMELDIRSRPSMACSAEGSIF
jgi:GntR family transcriptional regulator